MRKRMIRRKIPGLAFVDNGQTPHIRHLHFGGVKLAPAVSVSLVAEDVRDDDPGFPGRLANLFLLFRSEPTGSDSQTVVFNEPLDLAILPARRVSTRRLFSVKEAQTLTFLGLGQVIAEAVLADCAEVSIGLPGWPEKEYPEDPTAADLGKLQVRVAVSVRGYRAERSVAWKTLSRFLRLVASEEE